MGLDGQFQVSRDFKLDHYGWRLHTRRLTPDTAGFD
jgi:hypothetical protein